MAGLVNKQQGSGGESYTDLVSLVRHPMFGALQATLARDCVQQCVPFTLVATPNDGRAAATLQANGGQFSVGVNSVGGVVNGVASSNTNLLVEDATLQAEFRQLAPLGSARVSELETFYNTQGAAIVTARSDALAKVVARRLPPPHAAKEAACVTTYYDTQQVHLAGRVASSLALLKRTLPTELAQPGGATKRTKSRALSPAALAVMSAWYDQHEDNPYPTDLEKHDMAERGGISMAQVKAWFANKRNRSLNTKPKREKQRMESQLTQIYQQLAATGPNPAVGCGLGQPEISSTTSTDFALVADLAGMAQGQGAGMRGIRGMQMC